MLDLAQAFLEVPGLFCQLAEPGGWRQTESSLSGVETKDGQVFRRGAEAVESCSRSQLHSPEQLQWHWKREFTL